MTQTSNQTLLDLRGIFKAFPLPSGGEKSILENIDLTIKEGEIVGILGRSGSGKSTLLRIINGLMQPSKGEVFFDGKKITEAADGIAMVFQTFALFPWLTVLENVRLGLETLGVPIKEAEEKAIKAIDMIGLDGYESSYPREMSGGMRQRVGFARALVVNPKLLLMDEPFSALDVLTSQTLRNDLVDLWSKSLIPTKAILIVTHKIEEAVQLCDRVLIFGSNPGRIAKEIPIDLPHPRERHNAQFQEMSDHLYAIMTSDPKHLEMAVTADEGIATVLPNASASAIAALAENLAEEKGGKATLHDISKGVLDLDDLFPTIDAMRLLGLAILEKDMLALTDSGIKFGHAEIEERKTIFNQLLNDRIPLAVHIRKILDGRKGGKAPLRRFRMELEDKLTQHDSELVLKTIIRWARFAELFEFSEERNELYIGS